MTEREKHLRARKAWLVAAVVTFGLDILLRVYVPTLAPLLATPTSWVWGVVGFACHHGWLRRDAATAESVEHGHAPPSGKEINS